MRMSRKAAEHYRELADRYSQETGETEYQLAHVVTWADQRDLLDHTSSEIRAFYIERFSEALRSHTCADRCGRRVRLRHCVEINDMAPGQPAQQRSLWAHVADASDAFLLESLRQRRGRIGADVEALRADLDFINGLRADRGLPAINMTFNFDAPAEPDAAAGA